jgi:hypothetical protein
MTDSFVRRAAKVATFVMVFAGGYALGTLDVRPAEAQVGDLGKDLMNQAAGSGGALGSAAQLADQREQPAEEHRRTEQDQGGAGRVNVDG